MDEKKLLGMLVLDGCFIIELLLAKCRGDEDPLIGNMLDRTLAEHDLLLLENQLPFFTLESLFSLVTPSSNFLSLVDLFIKFFIDYLPLLPHLLLVHH